MRGALRPHRPLLYETRARSAMRSAASKSCKRARVHLESRQRAALPSSLTGLQGRVCRNQARIAVNKSLPPLWAYRGRFTENKPKPKPTYPFPLYGGRLGWGCRAQARICGRDARAPRAANLTPEQPPPLWIPAFAGMTDGGEWGKARMGRHAQARLCGRDARAPRSRT